MFTLGGRGRRLLAGPTAYKVTPASPSFLTATIEARPATRAVLFKHVTGATISAASGDSLVADRQLAIPLPGLRGGSGARGVREGARHALTALGPSRLGAERGRDARSVRLEPAVPKGGSGPMASQHEVAAHLDMSTRHVRELVQRGVLPEKQGAKGWDLKECRLRYLLYLRGVADGRAGRGYP